MRNRYLPLSVLAALFVSICLFQLLQALVLERTRPSKSDGLHKETPQPRKDLLALPEGHRDEPPQPLPRSLTTFRDTV